MSVTKYRMFKTNLISRYTKICIQMKKFAEYLPHLYFIFIFFPKQAFMYYSFTLTFDTMLLILRRHIILQAIALANSIVAKSALEFTILIVFACSIDQRT